METWHEVPGYPHIEVSRSSKVRTKAFSVSRVDRWGKITEYNFKAREIAPHESGHGYLRVHIQRNKVRAPAYVHRLVALTFVDGYQPGYHVNHIDGNKKNNSPENLEWIPNESNVRHAWRIGIYKDSLTAPTRSPLTVKKVMAIRRALSAGVTVNTVSILASVSPSTITKIKNGQSWANCLREEDSTV